MPTNNVWNSAIPIAVSKGGTGATTLTNRAFLVGSDAAAIRTISLGTTGTLCVGRNGLDPVFTTVLGGGFTFSTSAVGLQLLTIYNADATSATSSSRIRLAVANSTVGDPYLNFQITGGTQYSFGIDNSDSGTFKITSSSSPSGGSELMTITSAGNMTLAYPLAVPYGGTGADFFTLGGILYGNGSGIIQATAQMLDGQILVGRTGGPPLPATITSGSAINIVNGAASITVNATGSGIAWTAIGANQTLAVNNGYICTTGGTLSLALPTTAAVGTVIAISLDGSTGWKITQAVGQQIRIGASQSTLGATGYIASAAQGDSVRIVCSVANNKFNVVSSLGTITVF